MDDWWNEPDPAPSAPAGSAAPLQAAPELQPVQRPPVEAIAEILEALFVKEPELVTALLAELNRSDTATLAKLFGSPETTVSSPVVATELAPAKAVNWSKPTLSEPEQGVRWDSNGYRIPPKPSSLPWVDPYRAGSHWSR